MGNAIFHGNFLRITATSAFIFHNVIVARFLRRFPGGFPFQTFRNASALPSGQRLRVSDASGYALKTEQRDALSCSGRLHSSGQALGRLVPVSYTCCHASASGLSNRSSSCALTSSRSERYYLRGSFTLRCLQRLSRPHLVTQLCRWHDNWCARGASIPVLSY